MMKKVGNSLEGLPKGVYIQNEKKGNKIIIVHLVQK